MIYKIHHEKGLVNFDIQKDVEHILVFIVFKFIDTKEANSGNNWHMFY